MHAQTPRANRLHPAFLAPIVYALAMLGCVPEGLLPGIPAPTAGHVFDVVYTLAGERRYAPLLYHATRVGRRAVVAVLQGEGELGATVGIAATAGIARQAWPDAFLGDKAVYDELVPVQAAAGGGARGGGRRARGGQAATAGGGRTATAGAAGGGGPGRAAADGNKRRHRKP